jgi:hypothetical protein
MNDLCLLAEDEADCPPETDGGKWLIGNVKQQHASHWHLRRYRREAPLTPPSPWLVPA